MQQGPSLRQRPEERRAEKSPSFTWLHHHFRTLFLSWVTKNHLVSPILWASMSWSMADMKASFAI